MNDIYELANFYIKEAAGDSSLLSILDNYYNKAYGENYPNRTAKEDEIRREIVKAAETLGFTSTIDDFKNRSNSAKIYLKNNYQRAPKIEKEPEDKTSTSETSKSEQKFQDIDQKKWPTYEQFRRKYYRQLVDLGWPKDVTSPDYKDSQKDGGIVYPWSSNGKTAYAFSKRGKGLVSFRNYTQKIKTYLYNKFERDQIGLEKLSQKVDAVLDIEQQFLKKKKIPSMINAILMNIFRGIGGSAADENILKWLGSKIEGMTVFEYMKYILDEMKAKMSVSDDSALVLKNILHPLHKLVKDKCSEFYDISIVKLEYDNHDHAYESYFRVTTKTGSKDPKHNKSYSPYVYILEKVVIPILQGKIITSKSGRDLKCNYDVEDINKLIKDLEISSDSEVSKIIESTDDIIFSYDALDPENPKKIIGLYQIEFKYINKGCEIRVSFIPKKATTNDKI